LGNAQGRTFPELFNLLPALTLGVPRALAVRALRGVPKVTQHVHDLVVAVHH